MSRWFSLGELEAMQLAGLPGTRRGIQALALREQWQRPEWQGQHWRPRAGRGGGIEFTAYVLPRAAKVALAVRERPVAEDARAAAQGELGRSELWRWFEGLPDHKKAEAGRRLKVLDDVDVLVRAGVRRVHAMQEVARLSDIALSGIYRWQELVVGRERCDWLPCLAPRHAGRVSDLECPPEAWELLKADYLRLERPNLSDCLRRLQAVARERGWQLPSRQTLARRIEAIEPQVRVLAREGVDALKRLYPAQVRDRSTLHALEGVNADGHKWDVFVRWPDGYVGRPVMVAFQDLYSGMLLSWRVDRSENKEAVRLAFGDLVEQFGIPDRCLFDNGRNFASKWLTGGTPNRFRFKVRDDEPVGILTQMGVEVHWATPYAGQSKPIERAFRDFAQGLAKHPAFAGAYTGNTPMAKPENHGSAAVPLDVFLETIAEGIREHNARPGRQSRVCGGKLSFLTAFEASYAISPIRKATAEQRRLWLLAAEAIRVNRRDGAIQLEGNRFWSDFLLPLRGQNVVVRFDPQALQDDLHVYRSDGAYLGRAVCTEAAGFHDADAARAHGRSRRTWMRAQREILDAERAMSLAELVAAQPVSEEAAPPPETKVVRMRRGNTALKPIEQVEDDYERDAERQDRVIEALALAARRNGGLRLVLDEEV